MPCVQVKVRTILGNKCPCTLLRQGSLLFLPCWVFQISWPASFYAFLFFLLQADCRTAGMKDVYHCVQLFTWLSKIKFWLPGLHSKDVNHLSNMGMHIYSSLYPFIQHSSLTFKILSSGFCEIYAPSSLSSSLPWSTPKLLIHAYTSSLPIDQAHVLSPSLPQN